jgi:hypothetical protein
MYKLKIKCNIIWTLICFLCVFTCKAQDNKILDFNDLRLKLIDFVEGKKEITNKVASKYRSGEYTFSLQGGFNGTKNELKDGLYSFSALSSHGRGYFVFVEGDSFFILDISTKKGLENSINYTLDYAEKHKYCNEITQMIVSKLIAVYYTHNKNPGNAMDVNCESGISNTEILP